MDRLLPVAFAALLLAGCGSPAQSDGTSMAPGSGTSGGMAASLQAPLPLHAGDWWNYTVSTGGAWSYVVTAVGPSDYTMETDSASLSFFNARSDVSTLGPIRVSDLAGSQGQERVEFLHWPLRDGANWTTTWDGLPLHIQAHEAGPGRFDLTALRADGTAHATYTYDAAVRWFTVLDFKDEKGASAFKLSLQSHGGNFTGTVARWTLQPVVKMAGNFSQQEQPAQFEVPLAATDVWASITWSCSTGTATVGVAPMPVVTSVAGTDPRGARGTGQPCPAAGAFQGSVGAPQAPPQGGSSETWGYAEAASPGNSGPYTMEILVRTLTRASVGK